MAFENVVKDVERHDVSRLFLATLHLANARNVDICVSKKGEMEVKLLDRRVRSLEA